MKKSSEVIKEMEFTNKILGIVANQEFIDKGDFEGAIQAVIMQAIAYGKGAK